MSAWVAPDRFFDDGDAEGGGLSGSRLGMADYIAAFQDERYALGLDIGRLLEAHFVDGSFYLIGDGQAREGDRFVLQWGSPLHTE
jgi:hypothetical protein